MNATKKQPAITTTTNDNVLSLVFANGKQLDLDVTKLSVEIHAQAMLHGLKQKLVDAAAISCDPATGRAATIETKFEAVKEVFDRLLQGDWNKKREAGTQSGGLLFRALVKMYDGRKTPEEIKSFLASKTEAEKLALRKNEKVAAIIDELRVTSQKVDGIDTDELLAGL
jgi:hypothetical protein